jgi:hypothetical protein
MHDITLTPIEREAMKMLLDGNDSTMSTLRAQFGVATVAKKEMTGVGFFVNFSMPADVPRVSSEPNFEIGDVVGQVEGVKHGIGFLLFVTDGILSMLEGYTHDDPWPEQISNFKLNYLCSPRKLPY